MTQHASGTFDVKLSPQKPDSSEAERAKHGRMSLDKHYYGELDGLGAGEMLSAMTRKDSGVYVAIERVQGTLNGRKGAFLLQHLGVMTRGAQQLKIAVVPESGEEELIGIVGTMNIKIENGRHYDQVDYGLP